jgi:hypothetical protein
MYFTFHTFIIVAYVTFFGQITHECIIIITIKLRGEGGRVYQLVFL